MAVLCTVRCPVILLHIEQRDARQLAVVIGSIRNVVLVCVGQEVVRDLRLARVAKEACNKHVAVVGRLDVRASSVDRDGQPGGVAVAGALVQVDTPDVLQRSASRRSHRQLQRHLILTFAAMKRQ